MKKIKITLILIIVASAVFWGVREGQNSREGSLASATAGARGIFQQENIRAESTTVLPEDEFSFTATEESSVYELMQSLQIQDKITFTSKTYIGMGKFIDSINGLKNSGKENWIYYVNGRKASIGVSNYKLNPGDVVSWKYERLLIN